jgi:hypothetical protein
MQKAYLHLIQYAINCGAIVDVDDGGDQDEIHRGCTFAQAKEAVESVDVSTITVYTGTDKTNFEVALEYGQQPEETIYDYSVTDFSALWEAVYY